MPKFQLLIGCVVVFSGITFIVLLGDLPNYRGTLIHKLHILLVDKFTQWIAFQFMKFDRKFCNGYLLSDTSTKRFKWICGWLIPIFYLIIFTNSVLYFFQYTYSQIIEYEQDSNIKVNSTLRYWIFMLFPILINYASFLLAVFANPGYIPINLNNDNIPKIQVEFPYDNLIFHETKCSTCKFIKPARSKHCSNCNKCVFMFDHHCVWLNNDVAYYTYRWFLIFLVSICYILTYGGYLCYYSLSLYLKHTRKLPENISEKSLLKKYWFLMKRTTYANEISGMLLLLCILIFPIITFFLCENLWSIYLGVTTNETSKWNYVNKLIEHEVLYEFTPQNNTPKVYLILNDQLSNGSVQFVKLEDQKPFCSTVGGNLKKIHGWEDLDNIYDKGFWRNLYQHLFPKNLS